MLVTSGLASFALPASPDLPDVAALSGADPPPRSFWAPAGACEKSLIAARASCRRYSRTATSAYRAFASALVAASVRQRLEASHAAVEGAVGSKDDLLRLGRERGEQSLIEMLSYEYVVGVP